VENLQQLPRFSAKRMGGSGRPAAPPAPPAPPDGSPQRPAPNPPYIDSGALTPSNPSDSAIVVCAATDNPARNDSELSGVAPNTRQSR
jgi:hypothetical protein